MIGTGVAVTVVVWRRSKEESVLTSGFVVAVGDVAGSEGRMRGANWCMEERMERSSGGCGIKVCGGNCDTGAIAR